MKYGDIIEYIDGTRDLKFEEAQKWCLENNATLDELLDKRDLPKRYFQINEKIIPEPTNEELKMYRASAYQIEVDPITAHIQRLRDEEGTEQEVAELINERALKVEEIKQRYPYRVDNKKNQAYNSAELTL